MESSKFRLVKAKFIHSSSVLPPKNHEYSLDESVKTIGIQQPLIVRPLASKPGEYEVIDGTGRHDALDDPEQEVPVEVRQASDAGVFKISDATSKITQRNTCENAAFFSAYIQCVKEETGEEGALARVAAETQHGVSELSQYLTINKLFLKLAIACELDNEADFPKLKAMGINKVYKLAELVENPNLIKAAREIEKKADKITLEGISAIVENLQPSEVKFDPSVLDDKPAKVASADSVEESAARKRFKALTDIINAKAKETGSLVQSLEIEKLPATDSAINILEKMSVCFRRFSYYVHQLKEQKDACPKTG